MLTLVLFLLISDPQPFFFEGYLPLPNPRPEDCVIVPLDNPKAKDIVAQYLIITT